MRKILDTLTIVWTVSFTLLVASASVDVLLESDWANEIRKHQQGKKYTEVKVEKEEEEA